MTYTAYDGYHAPCVALTSIHVNDFIHKRWNWKKPAIISPHGEAHKNWVIFPERINGKFAILHSITPHIQIDYFDDLHDLGDEPIISHHRRSDREQHWDNWVRGVGPTPIKTEAGWLILYHAMDKRDPEKYKIGAMILDEKDPTKILYRSPHPLIEPTALYENEGYKKGVIYSCGAVLKNKRLYIYYGGADKVICGAKIHINQLIKGLKNSKAKS